MKITVEKQIYSELGVRILEGILKAVKEDSDEEKFGTHAVLKKYDNRAILEYTTCSGKGHYVLKVVRQEEEYDGALALFTLKFEGYRNSFLGGTLGWGFEDVPQFPKVSSDDLSTLWDRAQAPERLKPYFLSIEFRVEFEVKLHNLLIRDFQTSMPEKPLYREYEEPEYERPSLYSRVKARVKDWWNDLKFEYFWSPPKELESLE